MLGGVDLYEVDGSVQGDGRHGLRSVVGHLDGLVPLADVPAEQRLKAHSCQLMHGGDLD